SRPAPAAGHAPAHGRLARGAGGAGRPGTDPLRRPRAQHDRARPRGGEGAGRHTRRRAGRALLLGAARQGGPRLHDGAALSRARRPVVRARPAASPRPGRTSRAPSASPPPRRRSGWPRRTSWAISPWIVAPTRGRRGIWPPTRRRAWDRSIWTSTRRISATSPPPTCSGWREPTSPRSAPSSSAPRNRSVVQQLRERPEDAVGLDGATILQATGGTVCA